MNNGKCQEECMCLIKCYAPKARCAKKNRIYDTTTQAAILNPVEWYWEIKQNLIFYRIRISCKHYSYAVT